MSSQTDTEIKSTIENNDVVLFMKGTSTMPQCGFSLAVSNILKILENYSSVYGSYGIHPHEAKKHNM